MRMNRRFNRVYGMLTAPEVPRTPGGNGIALCHWCQRAVHIAGGFLNLLIRTLEREARFFRPSGTCPTCGSGKLYHIRRYNRTRCGDCRHEWGRHDGTARANAKKPDEWYERIIQLHRQGINPYRISKIIGANDPKGVYEFVKRLVAIDENQALTSA